MTDQILYLFEVFEVIFTSKVMLKRIVRFNGSYFLIMEKMQPDDMIVHYSQFASIHYPRHVFYLSAWYSM